MGEELVVHFPEFSLRCSRFRCFGSSQGMGGSSYEQSSHIHSRTRHDQPGWNLSGLVVMFGLLASKRFNRWTALFLLSTVATSLDWVLLSVQGPYAGNCRGCYFIRGVRCCDLCAVRSPPGRRVALDLRCHFNVSAVPQRVRPDRAAVPESACTKGVGSDAIGAAIFGYTTFRAGPLCSAYHPGGNQIPHRAVSSGHQDDLSEGAGRLDYRATQRIAGASTFSPSTRMPNIHASSTAQSYNVSERIACHS